MANLFERPIAAKPMSEFTAMPLQYIEKAMASKQQRYDSGRAAMYAAENEWLNTGALAGDEPRRQELIAGYEGELEDFVESVDGDYSRVQGFLDGFNRKIRRDLATGELGAINRNYLKAMQTQAAYDKERIKGNMSAGAMGLFKKSVSDYKTTPTETGYSQFSGYMPSTAKDPRKQLYDYAKNINEKYTQKGTKYLTKDAVIKNIGSSMVYNPEIEKGLRERYYVQTGKAPESDPTGYSKFLTTMANSMAEDLMYNEAKAKTNAGGNIGATDNMGRTTKAGSPFTRPSYSKKSMKGGSAMVGKELLGFAGVNATEDFDNWKSSEAGKSEIQEIEKRSGTKAPEDRSEFVNWYNDKFEQASNSPVMYFDRTQDTDFAQSVLSPEGLLLNQGRVYDQEGNVIEEPHSLFAKQSSKEGGRKGFVLGVTTGDSGYPLGSTLILGTDGKQYIQESMDTKVLSSSKYLKSKINSADRSPNGTATMDLRSDIVEGGKLIFPGGNYIVRKKVGSDITNIYKVGSPNKVFATLDKDGNIKPN